jgi:hypothetical protein
LPLFEPPIDPGLLVQAAAQGLSIASVLNDLNSPMPNYRFYFLLQKALEVCNELKALGGAFLSAKEKGDAEALGRLRAGHESAIQNLVMEVRKQQVDEAQKSLDALQQSRVGPVNRMQHYIQLIGADLSKVPSDATDFQGLTDTIEPPVDESGLKLISFEKEEMDKASDAADWQIGIGVVETLASIFHALPTINADAHPFGMGADVTWGFPNLADAAQAVARGLRIYADHLSYQSSSAGRKAGFLRQMQDRVLQANIAGFEIKNIDKQMLTQQIRINITNQEITNQQKQIDNAKEVEDFLRSKYTNQELYAWMEGEVRTLYHQAYTLAYDLAKKADDYVKGLVDLSQDEGLFAFFDLRHDFPNEWYKANNSVDGTSPWTMTLGDVYERLPFFTKAFVNGTPPKIKIKATDVYLFSSSPLSNPNIMLVQGTAQSVSLGPYLDPVKSFVANGQQIQMSGWQLTIDGMTTPLDQLWLVARYTLG